MEINTILSKIQNELKVPKGNFNSFGKYKYRSCEDILEAIKPILAKNNALLYLSDSIEQIGSKLFLKATANFYYAEHSIQCFGFAEITEHKGMSAEQCVGTASSYARKYALNGIFLIDETEQDADHVNSKQLPVLVFNSEMYNKVVARIQAGTTIEEVKKHFTLTEQIENSLKLIK